jgi:transposase
MTMFGISSETRVFLRTGVTDLRLNFEGLRALVINVVCEEPLSGHLFCFCNRTRNRIKCLIWDGSGFWVCAKRLERATFDWPGTQDAVARMSVAQLQLLLAGFELKSRRGWYRREEKMRARVVNAELSEGVQSLIR